MIRMNTSHMAYHAAVEAIENAGIKPEEIGLILVATVTPDRPFPSVSSMLQDQLGAKNAAAMDISAACAGFMYGVVTAKQFVESGTYDYVLVVVLKNYRKLRIGKIVIRLFFLVTEQVRLSLGK